MSHGVGRVPLNSNAKHSPSPSSLNVFGSSALKQELSMGSIVVTTVQIRMETEKKMSSPFPVLFPSQVQGSRSST